MSKKLRPIAYLAKCIDLDCYMIQTWNTEYNYCNLVKLTWHCNSLACDIYKYSNAVIEVTFGICDVQRYQLDNFEAKAIDLCGNTDCKAAQRPVHNSQQGEIETETLMREMSIYRHARNKFKVQMHLRSSYGSVNKCTETHKSCLFERTKQIWIFIPADNMSADDIQAYAGGEP